LTPLLLVGAGRMGGALVSGWTRVGALDPADLMILDPAPGPEAAKSGARLAPDAEAIGRARTVLLAVKPQVWRAAAAELAPAIAKDAMIVSVCAGVASADIRAAFAGRAVARVMPTTAAAIGKGAASVYAAEPEARDRARALFAPLGAVIDLDDEDQMHAATAVGGSAPAYVYAFVEALEAAGRALGLSAAAARGLARGVVVGAAALMDETGAEAADLRRQVTSPGGTTEAALAVLTGEGSLATLVEAAAAAAARRSRELGA